MTGGPGARGAEPPARLAAAVAGRPDVAALVIEATAELGATLGRFTATGETAGEIWYASADEAQTCAARDYGAALGPWRVVPAAETDPISFALHPAGER